MDCPFCRIKEKFSSIYMEGVSISKDKQFGAWIDYDEDKNGNILWYAVLNGDQYTKGHTLVISGVHLKKITGNTNMETLGSIIMGVNRVSKKLNDRLNAKAIHVLTLCEGQEHLHFHLIPRYEYGDSEQNFFADNYWEREKDKYDNKKDFLEAIKNNEHPIHGMWYSGFHEMNYRFVNLNSQEEIEDRINGLKKLTKILRNPELKDPFSL